MIKKILSKTVGFFEKNAVNKALNRAMIRLHFKRKVTGSICVWQGPSLFDGKPIQVVLSSFDKDSENDKTGAMIQIYILPIDETPYQVFKSKAPTVCGDCKYNGGGCYVRWSNIGHISKSARRNIGTLDLGQSLCAGLRIRVGAAGDPAAVPTYVWETLLKDADGFTGYTHSWKDCDPRLKDYFMASVDSSYENSVARIQKWKTFYVVESIEESPEDSIRCLAAKIKNNGLHYQCVDCMKCTGNNKATQTIVEVLHGATNTIKQAKQARGK